MNKKGFTLVEILSVIVILAIIFAVGGVSYNAIIERTRIKSYKNYEQSLKSSAMMYVIDNGYQARIELNDLLTSNKIDYFNNPKSNDRCLGSYVLVSKYNNDSSDLSYQVCLICPEYRSDGC